MPSLFALEYVCRVGTSTGSSSKTLKDGDWQSHVEATTAYLKRFSMLEKDTVRVTEDALALSREQVFPAKDAVRRTVQNHYAKLVPSYIKQAMEWFVLEVGRIRKLSGCTVADAVLILFRLRNRRRGDAYKPFFCTMHSWQRDQQFPIMNCVLESIHSRLHAHRMRLGIERLAVTDVDHVVQDMFGVFLFVQPRDWANITQLRQQYFDQLQSKFTLTSKKHSKP